MPQKIPIIIIGARPDGHAGAIYNCIQDLDQYTVNGFYDSVLAGKEKTVFNIPILGGSDEIPEATEACRHAFVAIGHNPARLRLLEQLEKSGYEAVTLIHPRSYVAQTTEIGKGVFIGPGSCVLNQCKIGKGVIINTGATIDHDCVLEEGVHVAPNCSLAGRVRVGKNTFLGIGSKVIPDIRIGRDVMVGAGAVLLENVGNDVMVAGMPATVKKAWHWDDQAEKKPENIYVSSPSVPALVEIADELDDILSRRMLSNFAKYALKFEEDIEKYLGVMHCRTVSNGTTGLALALKVLGVEGEVIVPDFTFCASGHVVAWNNCTPVLVDVDLEEFTIDIESIKENLTDRTRAIVAVNVFGNPCNVEALEELCREHGLRLIFDSAHAFGSQYAGRALGNFGDAEVFSFSGTKALTTGEGGAVTTNSSEIDEAISLARNYGAGSDYSCQFFGFNGKMAEINAVLGISNLAKIDELLGRREEIVSMYRKYLTGVPGIRFQKDHANSIVARSYFAVVFDPEEYGHTRDDVFDYLTGYNIFPKKYFHPPLHEMPAYSECRQGNLKNSTELSQKTLCIPVYPHLSDRDVERVAELIVGFHRD